MDAALDSSPPREADGFPLARVTEEIFRAIPLAVMVFDRSLRITRRNELAAMLFSAADDVSRLLAQGTVEGRYQDWAAELRRVMEAGTPQRFESVSYAPGQSETRLLDLICVPLRDGPEHRAIGGLLFAEDVTHRAGLERRVAVAERMAAVGRLAARVAHELNNPLDGVLRYINLTLRLLDPANSAKSIGYLQESRSGLLRMVQIIGELLEFSRSAEPPFEEAHINNVVEEAIRTFHEQAAEHGVVLASAFRDHATMPRIRGPRLFQICCNLIKNAIDAMPDGGTLTVTTALVGREVVLQFEDTGVGLPENTEVIFEPFYTTKPPGKGTGLGLPICRDYIARLNGSITAAPREGGGAVLTVRIPADSCEGGRPEGAFARRRGHAQTSAATGEPKGA